MNALRSVSDLPDFILLTSISAAFSKTAVNRARGRAMDALANSLPAVNGDPET
jgi:hypothetical protein